MENVTWQAHWFLSFFIFSPFLSLLVCRWWLWCVHVECISLHCISEWIIIRTSGTKRKPKQVCTFKIRYLCKKRKKKEFFSTNLEPIGRLQCLRVCVCLCAHISRKFYKCMGRSNCCDNFSVPFVAYLFFSCDFFFFTSLPSIVVVGAPFDQINENT